MVYQFSELSLVCQMKLFKIQDTCGEVLPCTNSWPRWLTWMCVQLVIRRLLVQRTPGLLYSFMAIDHEIFSMVVLSLPLIQEGQLSVSDERM